MGSKETIYVMSHYCEASDVYKLLGVFTSIKKLVKVINKRAERKGGRLPTVDVPGLTKAILDNNGKVIDVIDEEDWAQYKIRETSMNEVWYD